MSDWTRVDRKNEIFFHFLMLLCTKTVKNMLSWICWRYDSIFFITLCILPPSCHLSIALGWDNTRKLEERQKGNHDRNPLSENISEKLHFPISQFPASAPFAARDFLDCPNHLGKLGKVWDFFQPSWIWRRCHQSLKRVWIKVSQTSKVCTAYKHPIQSLNLNRLFSTTLLKIILCVIWLIFN